MVVPVRKVIDISHHNPVHSWADVAAAGILGVIHKATEGTSFVDHTYHERWPMAWGKGLLWGAYHFATASPVAEQVDHFLGNTGIHERLLYALDWEDYGSNTMSPEQAREFMERVDLATGRPCVLYSGNTVKEALGSRVDSFFGAHRLWLAQYGSNPTPQASWDDWWLWQYSDGQAGPGPHGCPGISGYVDTNSFDGSDAELAAEWSGIEAPPRERIEARVEISIVASGPVIVTVNGRQVNE
jgi:GH25 family lysozyme M1 (1,4-beta-N-acetylmuramidase)